MSVDVLTAPDRAAAVNIRTSLDLAAAVSISRTVAVLAAEVTTVAFSKSEITAMTLTIVGHRQTSQVPENPVLIEKPLSTYSGTVAHPALVLQARRIDRNQHGTSLSA